MNRIPKKVAIVGAGVAGARLAYLLSQKDIEVLLFDPKAPWEKPCGGGLTPKVFMDYPDLRNLDLDAREHFHMRLVFPSGRRTTLSMPWPIRTVSRERLGTGMLELATSAGAQFHKEKVESIGRDGDTIVVATKAGEYRVDLVVGADGVNSIVRKTFAKKLAREDLCLTYFALLPQEVRMPIMMKFFKGFQGYAWIFPRNGATSVGVACERGGAEPQDLIERLHNFVEDEWERADLDPPDLDEARAWFLPSMRLESFTDPPLCGKGWALVGDASGAADPLTGEGIYYALRTAEILARALSPDGGGLETYKQAWQQMAMLSIGKVSKVVHKFYRPSTLRLLGIFVDYSPSTRMLARELIAGMQDYFTLKPRVKHEAGIYIREALWNIIRFQKGQRKKKRRR